MKRYEQVAGFILAGGRSSRMGEDKGLLRIAGEPLVLRTARIIDPLVGSVAVVGPQERYALLGLTLISDSWPGEGPLGGLVTALWASPSEWNLVLACDMPYLHEAWLDWLIARALESAADAVVPETARGLEPLCAMYRTRAGAELVAALTSGVRKMTDALSRLAVERVTSLEWKRFDPESTLFRNLNSREEYARARAKLEPPTTR